MMANSSRITRKSIGYLARYMPTIGWVLESPAPLRQQGYFAKSEYKSDTLFVLLPGIQDQHLDFELAGFVRLAKENGLEADLLAVDAHVGYYVRQSILERLRKDVIEPARSRGYEKIWLVGTSLGGLGSALYAGRYEADVDGVLLFAPYLGQPSLIREIDRAGGPNQWKPAHSNSSDFHLSLWEWLGKYFESPTRKPNLYLGFGANDQFAFTNQFLAEVLPKDQVLIQSGSHNWDTWARLWCDFIDRIKS